MEATTWAELEEGLESKIEEKKKRGKGKGQGREREVREKLAGRTAGEKLQGTRQRQLADLKKAASAASSKDKLLMCSAPKPSQTQAAHCPCNLSTLSIHHPLKSLHP